MQGLNRFKMIVLVSAVVSAGLLTGPSFAQQAKAGTPAEARAMLEKVIVAVKTDKAKALAMFNKGDGGFKDRDLQPFCWDIKTGQMLASYLTANVTERKNLCELIDKTGKAFGKEQCAVATEGKFSEVSYMYPRPGETEPMAKVSFVTRIGDLGCGVGYYN